MKKVVLLLGGARSGKSSYAQQLAQPAEKVLFVATADAGDEDMLRRIEKHRQARPAHWRTLEAATGIGERIQDQIRDEELVIIDCITLLVSNLFCRYDLDRFEMLEDAVLEKEVTAEIEGLLECLHNVEASFIIVSNEAGLGIVPDNRMARLYRDILGRANQMLARHADEVYLMVAGIPLRVKPQS